MKLWSRGGRSATKRTVVDENAKRKREGATTPLVSDSSTRKVHDGGNTMAIRRKTESWGVEEKTRDTGFRDFPERGGIQNWAESPMGGRKMGWSEEKRRGVGGGAKKEGYWT